jgi:hypothetical protein
MCKTQLQTSGQYILLITSFTYGTTLSRHHHDGGTTIHQYIIKHYAGWLCLPPDFTLVSCSDHSSTLKMEAYVPSKRQLTFNGRHGVISQKIEHSSHWVSGCSSAFWLRTGRPENLGSTPCGCPDRGPTQPVQWKPGVLFQGVK